MENQEIKRNKEDFRDWMRPRLRDYYSARIDYLRQSLQEIIPEDFENRLIDLPDHGSSSFFDPEEIREGMAKPMRQYLHIGGKLFRPLLTCMFIEGYGKEPDQYKPVLAVSEIIHSCSLILDDIADASLLRRGQPCSHRIYGIPRAANASSAMTFYAYLLIRDTGFPLDNNIKLKLYKSLLWEHYITSVGSALDLGWAKDRRDAIPEDQYIQHILFRSSSYTYRHAARIGAIAGGADDDDLVSIFRYSSLLGVAFQFMDDILNLKPALPSWGKTVAEDITEGKRSPLVLHTLKEASGEDRERLLQILDDRITDPVILQEGVSILEKYDAFEVVRQKAEHYIEKACDHIQMTKMSGDYIQLLIDFAYYVIERKI
ncbi:MAG TPA: polyprenyl synthetase family protein [Bacteroidales bacterium]|nr:polyprenyl synthetase family protein [Bacteroidales bacterium]